MKASRAKEWTGLSSPKNVVLLENTGWDVATEA
jgi:hypothetical protein